MKKNNSNFEKPPYFRGLRWKITAAFVFLVFGLFIVLGILGGVLEYATLREDFAQSAGNDSQPFFYWSGLQSENSFLLDHAKLKKDSAELLPWLTSKPQNSDAMRIWLNSYIEKLKLRRKTDFSNTYYLSEYVDSTKTPLFHFIVFDRETRIITSSDKIMPTGGEHAEEKKFIEELLKENLGEKKELIEQTNLQVRFAFPIVDEQDAVKGVLFFRETLPLNWSQVFVNSIYGLFEQLIPNLIFFSILGFIFGSPFAWYLSKRLKKITFAAQSWRTGDFSAKTNDKSSDEIGILSRNLNEMADDIRENFALRQTIATAEERNRIARDLHDSVKQQVFGLAMQIGTAKALVENNTLVAKSHLIESEKLVGEIQQELVNLIRELSLINDEAESFNEKIESLTNNWSRQNNIEVKLMADDLPTLSPIVVQTFYRIIQESLANISRHSKATEIKLKVECKSKNNLQLSISDNGCGFDLEKTVKGFGLRNMRERAEQLPKGWLLIKSEIGKGTKVTTGCDLKVKNGEKI